MEHHAAAAAAADWNSADRYVSPTEENTKSRKSSRKPARGDGRRSASICTKKNILPFSVSARRSGFGPSPFPARLVIVVGSSRALGGGFVGFSKNPRFRFFQHCTIKEPPPYCMEFFVYEHLKKLKNKM
jgi:hypothetical protein